MILAPGHRAARRSRCATALEVMREHDISGVPVVEGERPGRHPHGARHPLRAEPRPARPRAHDEGARDGAARRLERRRQAAPPQAPHREAPRRRGRQARRPHHHQGHPPGRPQPAGDQGREGAPPRRRRHRPRPRSRSERTEALVAAGVDVIVVDTAHGHSQGRHRRRARDEEGAPRACEVIAGNVATAEATEALIDAGADAVKVGIGPGSICTTRVVAGVGVPQITAVSDCARVAERHDVPIIADGGVKYSGDVTKAIAAGASSGDDRLALRGHRRVAGRPRPLPGAQLQGVPRHGLARRDEAAASKDRYGQGGTADEKLVPEGIEGRVPHRGSLASILYQLVGGLRSGHGLHRAAGPSRSSGRKAQLRPHHLAGAAREPRARRDHHRRSAELLTGPEP